MTVTIIDYGLSNLLSVKRAFEYMGADTLVTSDPNEVMKAEKLVLPGVGAFADGIAGLKEKSLFEPIIKQAKNGVPLLGICLGMQMLLSKSEEFGEHAGLNLIEGTVERLPDTDVDGVRQCVPHIGWSRLYERGKGFRNTLLQAFPKEKEVYFVHSYEAKPYDPFCVVATACYGGREICAVVKNRNGNVTGCQFHPEKSGEAGLTIIEKFIR